MKISEVMTAQVLTVRPEETADVAARVLSRSNVGAVPVVDGDDHVVGMVTDRDLVVRCMARGLAPAQVPIRQIMTIGLETAAPQEPVEDVSRRMGQTQVRRMPVVEDGVLRGIVSLSDLARWDETAALALSAISGNVSRR